MAGEIKIKVVIDGQEAEKTLTELTDDVAKFGQEIKGVSEGGDEFKRLDENLKGIQEALGQSTEEFKKFTDQAVKNANSVGALRKEFLSLQTQLESAKDPAQIKQLNSRLIEVGDQLEKSKERVNDFNDALALRQGSGLERFRNSLGVVGEGLRNLDLDKVKIGFKGLGDVIKANPLFLLAGLIGTIIANFDELKKAGGLVGAVFTSIGNVLNGFISALKSLSDGLRLTSFATQDAKEKEIEYQKVLAEGKKQAEDLAKTRISEIQTRQDAANQALENQILLAKAQGKSAEELYKLEKQLSDKRIADRKEINDLFAGEGGPEDVAKRTLAAQKLEVEGQALTAAFLVKSEEEKRKITEEAQKRADERLKAEQKALEDFNKSRLATEESTLSAEQKIINDFEKERAEQKKKFEALSPENQLAQAENQVRALAEIDAKYTDQINVYKLEQAKKTEDELTKLLEESLDEQTAATNASYDERRAKIKEAYAKTIQDAKDAFNAIPDFGLFNLGDRLDALKNRADAELKVFKDKAAAGVKLTEEEAAAKKAIEEQSAKDIEELKSAALQKTLGQAQEAVSILSSLSQTQIENQQANLDRERSISEQSFEDRRQAIEKSVQSEEQKKAAIDIINQEEAKSNQAFDKKNLEIKKKQIKSSTAFAIAEIALSTAIAIASIPKIAGTTAKDPVTFGLILASGIAAVIATMAKAKAAIKDANAAASQLGAGGGSVGGADIGGGAGAPAAAFSTQTFQPTSINQSQGINGQAGGAGTGFIFNPVVSVSEINQVQNQVQVGESQSTFGPG